MKKLISRLSIFLMVALVFASCKKLENQVVYEGGTAPVLSASTTGPLVLSLPNKDVNAVTFSWTNPNYQFNSGLSSHDVTYTIQVDSAGRNFAGTVAETVIPNALSKTLTQGELNSMLKALGLAPAVAANIDVRLKASFVSGAAPLYSNVVRMNVTPYLVVLYPVPANLYIIGNATPDGWGNPVSVNQKLTQINAFTFQITLNLVGGNSYLFIPVNGSWGAKYGGLGANNTNNPDGDNFKPDGGDLLAPTTSGSYKITVNFENGKFTVVRM